MARNRRQRRQAASRAELPITVLDTVMQQHLHALGHGTVDAYLAWCRRHGFAAHVAKGALHQRREHEAAVRLRAIEHVAARGRVRNPAATVRRVLAGEGEVPAAFTTLAAWCRSDDGRGRFAASLLQHLRGSCPRLLQTATLPVLERIVVHWDRAVRQIESWTPTSHNDRRCLIGLIGHLFARYAVPRPLENVWFDAEAALHRGWYLHVGAGNNLRTAQLPIPYSRRMAHAFPSAPADCDVLQALRWGQVLGLGGDAALARALLASRIGRSFADDAFWVSVIRFFVRHGLRDAGEIGAAVDYLHQQRCAVQLVVDEQGQHELPPPQPHLSMHGRTPAALRRQIDDWHRRLGRAHAEDHRVRWQPTGIAGFRSVVRGDEVDTVWAVRELCSLAELRHESSVMRHCVASYADRCRLGGSSIWTMTVDDGNTVRTVLTMEVRDRVIVQARGRANARAKSTAKSTMLRWAALAGLGVAAGA